MSSDPDAELVTSSGRRNLSRWTAAGALGAGLAGIGYGKVTKGWPIGTDPAPQIAKVKQLSASGMTIVNIPRRAAGPEAGGGFPRVARVAGIQEGSLMGEPGRGFRAKDRAP